VSRSRCLRAAAVLAVTLALAGCFPKGPPAPAGGFIHTGYSFDTCAAPSTSSMQTWFNSSVYRAVGVYLGGSSAACPPGPNNPNLTAGWVNTVENQGWRLIPLYVGNQAPCTGYTHKIDTNNPAGDGVAAGEDAANRAANLGIGPGSPIYLDVEYYPSDGAACSSAVLWFVHGWVNQLRARGYVGGFYSSGSAGVKDEVSNVANNWGYTPPDELFFANWNNNYAVPPWGDPWVPDSMWANHQRHHQYQGGHNETHPDGGVTINIDSTASDGMVAGR
jgi:hypothetical protein